MSRYYARGSAYAKNIIADDKDHFGKEWQEGIPVSAALSYILHVILSEDVLFGGHSNWINDRIRGTDSVIVVDRDATMRRFKRGEITYKETFLGGCTNLGDCKQTPLKWLDVECLKSCTHLVGRLSKLETVIAAQTHLVESLNPSSVEYRGEKADLEVLIATRNKVLLEHKSLETV